jgi:organic hydroperoxide reductase OsmC/OhrA
MKTLFVAEAISKGGRSGTIHTPDGLLDVTLAPNQSEKQQITNYYDCRE